MQPAGLFLFLVTQLLSALDELYAENGRLSRVVENYRPRLQQLELSRAVAQAMAEKSVLVAEAGTGTGKTLAYLVPALLAGGKTLVSTGTKALQDQLYHRDLPRVRAALGLPVQVALLKGRANYLCRHHLERTLAGGRLRSREEAGHLQAMARFAERSLSGDRSELSEVPENASAWGLATSTRENCLGGDCPQFRDCFVMRARKQALEAELVVVNHHLFFADLWLRDEGVGELLPNCHSVILDEAHQLPDAATVFFGTTLASGQVLDLAQDSEREGLLAARDFPQLGDSARALDKAVRDWRLALPETAVKLPAEQALARGEFAAALGSLREAMEALERALASQAERGEELALCHARARNHLAALAHWQGGEAEDAVLWMETTPRSVLLHASPLSIAGRFREQLEKGGRAWVFTSATLRAGDDFSHFLTQLGLEEATRLAVASPFDYVNQALLYVPQGLPAPNSREHTSAVIQAALPVLKASRGRAFFLFTSLRALQWARRELEQVFVAEGLGFPLFVQGEAPKRELLEAFQRSGNGVLLGSQSFWEGVDIPGNALSLVIIDKLPFTPPDDPVVAARMERIRQSGGNPFMDHQLPEACISLKQGAGRLIRTETDRGVLMICDPRLADKPYGRVLLKSLPPMPRTRSLARVQDFFAALGGGINVPDQGGGAAISAS